MGAGCRFLTPYRAAFCPHGPRSRCMGYSQENYFSLPLRHYFFCFGGGAGVPVSMPMALRSSSMSSQCTPCPVPIVSKFWRCSGVAFDRRQDHASGTLIVRPSARWAVIRSSVTSTAVIRESLLATMVMPCLHAAIQMVENDRPNAVQFSR
jgi:hypothetical protein